MCKEENAANQEDGINKTGCVNGMRWYHRFILSKSVQIKGFFTSNHHE